MSPKDTWTSEQLHASNQSRLRWQLSHEFCKAISDHKSFIEILDILELLVSMIEMAYGLPYKHDNHTTAINLINAQWEKIYSQATSAREQDRLEMIRTLHAARVESGNGKSLNLEILLNQIGGRFKPDEEVPTDDD